MLSVTKFLKLTPATPIEGRFYKVWGDPDATTLPLQAKTDSKIPAKKEKKIDENIWTS